MVASARGVRRGEAIELGDHLVYRVADAPIAADQIGVVVAEHGAVAVQRAAAQQVEEYGAAADERLEVAAAEVRIKTPQHRQQLPFAADPLEKRAADLHRVTTD